MEEVRIDVRTQSAERIAEAKRSSDLCFRINHTNPTTPECQKLIKELLGDNLGEAFTNSPSDIYEFGR